MCKNENLMSGVICMGKDLEGKDIRWDYENNPNCAITGGCGTGKTALMQHIIMNVIKNAEGELYIFDTKYGLEYGCFQDLPKTTVIYCEDDYSGAFKKLKLLMTKRFRSLSKAGFTSFQDYINVKCSDEDFDQEMRPCFIIIDEINNLLYHKSIDLNMLELIRKGRSVGVYFIVSSISLRTSNILLEQFSTQISFRTINGNESRHFTGDDSLSLLKNYYYVLKEGGKTTEYMQPLTYSPEAVRDFVVEHTVKPEEEIFELK